MDTRRNMPLEFELAEKKGRRDFLLEKAGEVRKTVVDTAKKGLKGGVVGASAAATKGVITGATTVAIGKIAATGIGGVIAGTGAGAAALSAVPLIAGFSAACVAGTVVKSLIDEKEN